MSKGPLRRLRILVKDDDEYCKYANVDWLDQGNGLLIYDYETGEKVSRHSDGNIYRRVPGASQSAQPTTSVPFSDIQHEQVRVVPIPVDSTQKLPRYLGTSVSNAFVFSSTALSSNATFAAEVVDDSRLTQALSAWQNHPDYVSAQTCRANELGKTVILTVLNRRSGSTGDLGAV